MTARTLTETFFKRKQKKMWLALGYGLMNYYRAGEKKNVGWFGVCVCVSPPQKIFQPGDLRTRRISEFIVVLICTSVSNPGPRDYILQRGLTTSTVEYDLYGKVGTHMGPVIS
jgi:hypothetical protein